MVDETNLKGHHQHRFENFISAAFQTRDVSKKDQYEELLQKYQSSGASSCKAETGKVLWQKKFKSKDGSLRSCVSCHGSDMKIAGSHAKSKKVIAAMSPSVNKKRFTKVKKVEKWFKRNCKWTLGRVCTIQEKCDYLMFLKDS